MEIFLVVLTFFSVTALNLLIILYIYNSLLPKIKSETKRIEELDEKIYIELRELQYNSKNLRKTIDKLTKQNNSFLNDIIGNLAISLLPFKKLKKFLLIFNAVKKIL